MRKIFEAKSFNKQVKNAVQKKSESEETTLKYNEQVISYLKKSIDIKKDDDPIDSIIKRRKEK